MELKGKSLSSSENVIIKVEQYSIAEEMEIEPGDILVSINDSEVKDIFDYRFVIKDEYLEVVIRKPHGEEWLLEIEKDEDEDLGIIFETGLMDKAKSCSNKCIFCFIDQLPKGMRETLYFKDDDSRLSFLQGNYVTLTNMKEEDLARIIFYKLSPINISVHTTDPDLRQFMLKNPKSRNIMESLKKIYDAGIEMNFQIVLCKGINDGVHLDKTIGDLSAFLPLGKSLSVVPVGISKYRENLYPMEVFNKNDAEGVIEQVENWQKKLKNEFGTNFVFASDEFYLKAERVLPEYEAYEDFPQIENGVGMLSSFKNEFNEALSEMRCVPQHQRTALITGVAAGDFIKNLASQAEQRYNIETEVFVIENTFFGENITVSGLLCGQDIIRQLKGRITADRLLIPENALRDSETVFLDDLCIEDLEQELNVKIEAVKTEGRAFLLSLLGL